MINIPKLSIDTARAWAPYLFAIGITAMALVVLTQCTSTRQKAAVARVEGRQAGAAMESAADAINTVSTAAQRDQATDQTHEENADAIRAQPGAAVPVDPAIARAAIDGLCRYSSYRNAPQCVQRANPR